MTPKSVNLQTGRFVYQHTDISVGPLKFTRMIGTGNSSFASGFGTNMGPVQGWQFNGWTHNYSSSLKVDNSATFPLYRVTVDATQYTFKDNGAGGSPIPADGNTHGMRLWSPGTGQWTMIDHSGNQYDFSGSGSIFLLQSALYADGTRTTITYTGNQPKLIRSNLGYAIVLDYVGSTISAACGFNTAETYVDASTTCSSSPLVKATYGYDSAPHVTTVTDTRNGTTTITYAATGNSTNIYCISLVGPPGTCAIQNLYGQGVMTNADQVTTQTAATGGLWHYDYTPEDNPQDVPVVPCRPRWSDAAVTDPTGRWTRGWYDRGFLVQLNGTEGEYDYLYPNGCSIYGAGQIGVVSVETRLPRPAYVRKPGGVREYYEYDSRGNVTKRAILPIGAPDPPGLIPSDPELARCCVALGTFSMPAGSLVTQAAYLNACEYDLPSAKLCDKPMSVTDPKGNTTTFTYDPAHGGVLTETRPSVNGVTPQTRYTYVTHQAWVKNSSSGMVPTGENIYLLDTKSICKTGNPNSSNTGCAMAGDEVVTKYYYGPEDGSAPNNLLLRSITEDYLGLSLRTCYKYDSQGNRVSETKPRGTGSGCPA